MELCYIEGQFVPPEEAKIPVSDLMIQRGVGVFETIGTWKRRPLMLTPHLERLLRSASSSRICPLQTLDEMKKIVKTGIQQVEGDIQVKVYLSGGDEFDEEKGFTQPRLFAVFEKMNLPAPEAYEKGVSLEPVPIGREDPSVKSVDYRSTYSLTKGAFEVLYCPKGEITEAGHSTFFMILKGVLVTAPLSRVLKGTTRQIVLELASREGLRVEERCPLLTELAEASEAFITGSVKKILPVVRVGERTIGTGHPGKVTARLSDAYLQHIEQWLE